MKNHNFRITVFAVALLVSLGLFLGGFSLHRELVARNTRTGLTTLCGGPVQLEKEGKVTAISVQLGQVNNLQETWKAMTDFIEKDTASDKYRIVIKDKRNDDLQTAFDHLQPVIYEAAANNTFVALQQEFEQYLGDKDIDYRLYLDNQRMYLQMKQGDHYLYQVIDRVNVQEMVQAKA